MNPEDLLKTATQWSSISSGTRHRLNQISGYDWISKDTLEKCSERIENNMKLVGHNLEDIKEAQYETFFKRNSPEQIQTNEGVFYVDLYGYLDTIVGDSIWEFKCTEKTDPIYFIQLALYIFISEIKGPAYLFNVFTNELYSVTANNTDLHLFIFNLFKAKYFNKNYKLSSDSKFLQDNLTILENYTGE